LRLGIRYRLLVPLGLLLVGVVGASLWSAHIAARRAEARVARQVHDISQTLAAARYPLTSPVLEQVKSYSGAEFIFVRADGVRISTFATEPTELPSDVALDAAGETELGPPVNVAGAIYRCRRLLLKDPHPFTGGMVLIFYPEAQLDEAIADAERPSFLGLAFGLLAVGLTFGIGQRLVNRIRTLERRTREIAAGDFSPMPLPRTNDELRDLSASVNEMADRLARLQQAVQTTERLRLTGQLASGLAHQLRNSATGAKLAVQVYLAEHTNDDAEALAVTLRQLTLMEANLRRFIDLGRPSAGRRSQVSLSTLLTDVVDLHRPRCKHVGIDLHWNLPATDICMEGDEGQLGDLFANLIGNAVDAVGNNGEVAVTLDNPHGQVIIEVSDTGAGPAPDVAARLFEPFVTGQPEGIGLGLAVARHAAEAHNGRITWRRDEGRTVFRVEFPAAKP
jgi:signal transduction histidine kinase